jgi:PAS domain S-box-containing protein
MLKLDKEHLNILFPFFLKFKKNLVITNHGISLKKITGNLDGKNFFDEFYFKRPSVGIKNEFNSITEYTNQVFIIQSKTHEKLKLRGQFSLIKNELLFTGSPWILNFEDLEKLNLLITDFSLFNPVIDLLQILNARESDIKELIENKKSLQEKNEIITDLAKFTSENPNPVFRILKNGVIDNSNKASNKILKTWAIKNVNCSPYNFSLAYQKCITTNAIVEVEIKNNEEYFSFLLSPVNNIDKYVNVYGKNITTEKLSQLSLKENEAKYKQLVEEAHEMIYKIDLDGYFTYINPKAQKVMKFEGLENGKTHFTSFIRADWKKKTTDFYMNQLTSNTELSYFEFPCFNVHGEEIWVGQNVKVVSSNGKTHGFQVVARDITERKILEQSLKDARKKAEESAQFKAQFMANMSHEIRTPMNGILGMSSLIDQALLSPKDNYYLKSIKESARGLLNIINDILDISKIESGELKIEKIGFQPIQICKTVINTVEYLASQKDLYISLNTNNIQEKDIYLGDPHRLNQILTNLLSNAIKFSKNGEIQVCIETIVNENNGKSLKFSIIDQGIGIPKDKFITIFQSFKQSDITTTRMYGGTGLGLSICKSLVDMQKGTIWVKSKENEGSTFFFQIPYKKGVESDLILNNVHSKNYDISNCKILLVEDHKINQVYAQSSLQLKNAIVEIAENGKIALKKIKEENFDIILMDIQMPVMGGIEATKIIRTELKNNIPIIALTANALKGQSEKYFECGMDDYISKPFEIDELVKKIGQLLDTNNPNKKNKAIISQKVKNKTKKKKLFSLNKLKTMSNGNQIFIRKIIQTFIEETPKTIKELNNHLSKKEYPEIRSIAHKMKPFVTILEIDSIKNDILHLEDATKPIKLIPNMVDKVSLKCNDVIKELKQDY